MLAKRNPQVRDLDLSALYSINAPYWTLHSINALYKIGNRTTRNALMFYNYDVIFLLEVQR